MTMALKSLVLSLLRQVSVSLHTSNPMTDGRGEISGGGYGRKGLVSFAGDGENDVDLVWTGMPPVIVGGVSHIGLWDSDGHFLAGGELDKKKLINAGDTFVIFAGEARVQVQ